MTGRSESERAPGHRLPLWRSILFVPVNVPRFVERAHERGADAIALDLEDSITAPEKTAARALVADAAHRVGRGGADILVRINAPLRLAVRDIEASVWPHVRALMLPKCESPDGVRALAELVGEVEAERGMAQGHTLLVPLIESCEGYFRMLEIARAHRRVVALAVGAEDFSASAGMEPGAETLLHPKQEAILAARAAGILPLGYMGSPADLDGNGGLLEMARRARRFGSTGAMTVHPAEVPVLNAGFSPSEDELTQATELLQVFEKACAAGQGSIRFKGRMVDLAVAERARSLLDRFRPRRSTLIQECPERQA